jgi:hypothetical protein
MNIGAQEIQGRDFGGKEFLRRSAPRAILCEFAVEEIDQVAMIGKNVGFGARGIGAHW